MSSKPKPQLCAVMGVSVKPGTRKVPGPFLVPKQSLSTQYVGAIYMYVSCCFTLLTIVKGIARTYKELFQPPGPQFDDLLFCEDYQDTLNERGITGNPDKIAEVAVSTYQLNFQAFFVDTMLFYFEDDERQKYSVVFGRVKGEDMVSTKSNPLPYNLENKQHWLSHFATRLSDFSTGRSDLSSHCCLFSRLYGMLARC
jgi:hypothetical protein